MAIHAPERPNVTPNPEPEAHDLLPWYKRRAVIIGGSVAALVATGTVLLGMSGNERSSNPNAGRPTAAAPATPGMSESTQVSQSPEATPTASETESSTETDDQLISKLDKMDINTFNEQPQADRVKYGLWLSFSVGMDPSYSDDFSWKTPTGKAISEYDPLTVGKDGAMTPEDELYSEIYLKQLALSIASRSSDSESAQKVLSLSCDKVTTSKSPSEVYEDNADFIKRYVGKYEEGRPVSLRDEVYKFVKVLDASKDKDGNRINTVQNSLKTVEDGNHSVTTFNDFFVEREYNVNFTVPGAGVFTSSGSFWQLRKPSEVVQSTQI